MPIEISGLEDVSNMLTEVAPKAAKAYMVKTMKPAAEVVINALSGTVPVGVGILEEQLVYKNKWVAGEDGGDALECSIGPTKSAFWGMFQEFGTSKMAGKHWMVNAWDGCKDEVLNTFMDGIHTLYEKLIARDMSEAVIEDDAQDREMGRTTPRKLRQARNAAHRENNARDRKAGGASAQRIVKDRNEAYRENERRKQ